MTRIARRFGVLVPIACLMALWSAAAQAQTADEIIEKHIAASGGRAALSKLTSRVSTGTISLTTPAGDVMGSVEVYAKPPNKQRTYVKLDLSALGGPVVISDQRFDGTTGYVIDTFNGNREITGSQLEALKYAGTFPSPMLTYKEQGVTATLGEREKIDGQDVYLIRLTPKAGPPLRLYIDSATSMMVRTVVTVNIPQLGGDVEQIVNFSDFRDVDGVKIPFVTRSSNSFQEIRAVMSDVKHNTAIDDSMFVRPAGQ